MAHTKDSPIAEIAEYRAKNAARQLRLLSLFPSAAGKIVRLLPEADTN